jgi:hypothetical protein
MARNYAVDQHERLDYHHEQRGPKFLENAPASERGTVARIMQGQFGEAFGS